MSAAQKRHTFYWLPNALTLGRIALIPILIGGILAVGHNLQNPFNAPKFVITLFAICALTDFLDGYFARKWNLVSDFGRMLDPIADKLLVAGCLIAFMINFGPHWWFIAPSIAIIFRDIFISGTREHAANSNIILPPTKLAKWKTAAEMLAIFLFLLTFNTNENAHIFTHIGLGFLWLAACLSLYTGLHYIRATFR